MSSSDSSSGDVFILVAMAGVFVYLVSHYWRNRKRTRRVDQFLFANGFEESFAPGYFPKGLLPDSLTNGSLQRCWKGNYRGYSAVIGVVRVPFGEDYYDQTFVAVERPSADRYEAPPLIRSLEMQFVQEGRWVVGTIHRHAMDVEAIEGYLTCFT